MHGRWKEETDGTDGGKGWGKAAWPLSEKFPDRHYLRLPLTTREVQCSKRAVGPRSALPGDCVHRRLALAVLITTALRL